VVHFTLNIGITFITLVLLHALPTFVIYFDLVCDEARQQGREQVYEQEFSF
jgi:hypothetical protein